MSHAAKTETPQPDTSRKSATGESGAPFSGIHDSPRMVAQRQQLHGLFGGAAQLQALLEDETPVQARFEPGQRMSSQAQQPSRMKTAPGLQESPLMQDQLAQLRRLFGDAAAGVVQRSSEKVTMNLGEDQDEQGSGHDLDAEQDDVEPAKAIDAKEWLDMSAPVAARFWELVHEDNGVEEEPDATIQTSAGVKKRLHELFDDDPSIDFDGLLSLQMRLTAVAPTDEQTIALGFASQSGNDTDDHEGAVVSVRDQLLNWLMQIAVHDMSSAEQNMGQIQALLGRVTNCVAQIAGGAMNDVPESGVVFQRLLKCGFVERLVNIVSLGLLNKAVCHHTDTSIPLINCLAGMTPAPKPAAVRLPGATRGLEETPINRGELEKGLRALRKQAGFAFTALGKIR
jgi:hypothetical protein